VLTDVTAFAPATVANVGIGFDILGHTVDAVGDRVRLRRIDEPVVRIRAITGVAGDLPIDAKSNTAGRAVQAMHAALRLDYGFEIDIDKGIPLASGMGGSAASAVAAVVAANALLQEPVPRLQLLKFAMEGEIVASGSAPHRQHRALPDRRSGADGGNRSPARETDSRAAVAALRPRASAYVPGDPRGAGRPQDDVTRSDFVWPERQSRRLISGCYSNDLDMIRDSFNDVIIEPQRHSLIPGFKDVQRACDVGGGVWAARFPAPAPRYSHGRRFSMPRRYAAPWLAAFTCHGLESDCWISSLEAYGARV